MAVDKERKSTWIMMKDIGCYSVDSTLEKFKARGGKYLKYLADDKISGGAIFSSTIDELDKSFKKGDIVSLLMPQKDVPYKMEQEKEQLGLVCLDGDNAVRVLVNVIGEADEFCVIEPEYAVISIEIFDNSSSAVISLSDVYSSDDLRRISKEFATLATELESKYGL